MVKRLRGIRTVDQMPQPTEAWKKFYDFHQKRPHFYEMFKVIAFRAKDKGIKMSGRAIGEIIRWRQRALLQPSNTNLPTIISAIMPVC